MNFKFDKDDLKESLTIDQIFELTAELGGEPLMDKSGTFFTAKTICHNHIGEGSHKLYYYDNTHLFRCYTDCGTSFDIYELVTKVRKLAGDEWPLPKAIAYVANYFGVAALEENFDSVQEKLEDWEILNNYKKYSSISESKQIVELKIFEDNFLNNLPHPRILPWENEGITKEVMSHRGICYDPHNQGIVIPHYDIDGKLVGIRERTLIKEDEVYGKYRPAILNKKMYNHPLGFNLYNLNNSKNTIDTLKKAIIFESEKSCLKYASYFGEDNDISVAVCGSSLIMYQVKLLLSCGAEEIIIAFDREGQNDNKAQYVKKFYNMQLKYGSLIKLSFIYDKQGERLGYKDSPIDRGPEIFIELFKERITL